MCLHSWLMSASKSSWWQWIRQSNKKNKGEQLAAWDVCPGYCFSVVFLVCCSAGCSLKWDHKYQTWHTGIYNHRLGRRQTGAVKSPHWHHTLWQIMVCARAADRWPRPLDCWSARQPHSGTNQDEIKDSVRISEGRCRKRGEMKKTQGDVDATLGGAVGEESGLLMEALPCFERQTSVNLNEDEEVWPSGWGLASPVR